MKYEPIDLTGFQNLSGLRTTSYFGFGAQTTVQRIEATWPNSHIQTLEGHSADRAITIVEAR